MELPSFPFSSVCEKYMIRSYEKNTGEGRKIDLSFIQDAIDDRWYDNQKAKAEREREREGEKGKGKEKEKVETAVLSTTAKVRARVGRKQKAEGGAETPSIPK